MFGSSVVTVARSMRAGRDAPAAAGAPLEARRDANAYST
jgi:hypothetical protein